MKFIISALATLALTACMGTMGYSGMSADQIKALGKESNISCVDGTSVWGRVRSIFINVDKGVVDDGGVEVSADCNVKFLNKRQLSAPKIPDPKLPSLPELQWAPSVVPAVQK